MGIPIEKSFVVKAPVSAVWEFLTDPRRVASCLPGAAITEQVDATTFGGTIAVKVGPVLANYRGKMHFERLDAAAHEAEISASGQETRGKGGADMRMKSRIAERAPGESEVTVTSDVNVVGVLAQFGRGMIQDVSALLFQKFTDAMRRQLETPAAAAPGAVSASGAGAPPAAGPAAVATGAAPAGAAAPVAPAPPPAAPARSPAAGDAATRPTPARLVPVPAAQDDFLDVGAIGATAARRAAARTLRRPALWIALAVAAAIVGWWLLR
jgi:carbon monoxide dehydrogenase subunit G